MKEAILFRVYTKATLLISVIFFSFFIYFEWSAAQFVRVAVACLSFVLPVILFLHLLFTLKKFFAGAHLLCWLILFASLPFMVMLSALLWETTLPGNTWFLLISGLLISYIAILSSGLQIAGIFKNNGYENQ